MLNSPNTAPVMFPKLKSASPGGRFQIRVNVWEASNSHWVESPEIWDVMACRPLYRFDFENWSVNRGDWTGRAQVMLVLRKYPGSHQPSHVLVLVDCDDLTACVPPSSAMPLAELEVFLNAQLTWR